MINYRFDLFKKFKQFDIISMIDLENTYQELLGKLINYNKSLHYLNTQNQTV